MFYVLYYAIFVYVGANIRNLTAFTWDYDHNRALVGNLISYKTILS